MKATNLERKMKKLLLSIKSRCNNTTCNIFKYYGAKGITNSLCLDDLIYLWERDQAFNLNEPSIDRINNSGNYTLSNCQFIEMSENRIKDRMFEPTSINIRVNEIIKKQILEESKKRGKSISKFMRWLFHQHLIEHF